MMFLDSELPVEVLSAREQAWDRSSVGYPGTAYDLQASKCTLVQPTVEQRPNHVTVKVTRKIRNIREFLKEV